jgi:hypothetical protein
MRTNIPTFCINFVSYLTHFLLEREMFRTEVVKKIKTFIFNNLKKNHGIWDNVEKYGATEKTKDDNMAHAQCIMDT